VESVTRIPRGAPSRHARGSEIAWFQGSIDEAFSHHGCPDSHPRRTLFRF
jgi:hypothetical protein